MADRFDSVVDEFVYAMCRTRYLATQWEAMEESDKAELRARFRKIVTERAGDSANTAIAYLDGVAAFKAANAAGCYGSQEAVRCFNQAEILRDVASELRKKLEAGIL